MTEDYKHPIIPPPELVQQWAKHVLTPEEGNLALDLDWFAAQAAQWGSDQELKACCEWLYRHGYANAHALLPAARRPKPPTLKKQALEEIQDIEGAMYNAGLGCDFTATRRALEQLDD